MMVAWLRTVSTLCFTVPCLTVYSTVRITVTVTVIATMTMKVITVPAATPFALPVPLAAANAAGSHEITFSGKPPSSCPAHCEYNVSVGHTT